MVYCPAPPALTIRNSQPLSMPPTARIIKGITMAKAKKTASEDVKPPGKAAPSATSKPVIITNRPILKDPAIIDEEPVKEPLLSAPVLPIEAFDDKKPATEEPAAKEKPAKKSQPVAKPQNKPVE